MFFSSTGPRSLSHHSEPVSSEWSPSASSRESGGTRPKSHDLVMLCDVRQHDFASSSHVYHMFMQLGRLRIKGAGTCEAWNIRRVESSAQSIQLSVPSMFFFSSYYHQSMSDVVYAIMYIASLLLSMTWTGRGTKLAET